MGGMLSSRRFGVVDPERWGKPGVTGVDIPEGSSSTIKRTRWRCSYWSFSSRVRIEGIKQGKKHRTCGSLGMRTKMSAVKLIAKFHGL